MNETRTMFMVRDYSSGAESDLVETREEGDALYDSLRASSPVWEDPQLLKVELRAVDEEVVR